MSAYYTLSYRTCNVFKMAAREVSLAQRHKYIGKCKNYNNSCECRSTLKFKSTDFQIFTFDLKCNLKLKFKILIKKKSITRLLASKSTFHLPFVICEYCSKINSFLQIYALLIPVKYCFT